MPPSIVVPMMGLPHSRISKDYVLRADGDEVSLPAGSYVGALVYARCAAVAHPGICYVLVHHGKEIARYQARGDRLVEAWVW